jgi:hypothetical protein
METLEQFRQNQRVIEDFTARTLAAIPGAYARLAYLASLRDAPGADYRHDGLAALYPAAAVQQALRFCHEELFARVLELPLEQQEWDLRSCLGRTEAGFWEAVADWRERATFRELVPEAPPAYLGDLFCSNVSTLLALYSEERPTMAPAT